MHTRLPYGKKTLDLELPGEWSVTVLQPKSARPLADPEAGVRSSLDGLTSDAVRRLRGAHTVAIAVNDKTRPVPHAHLLLPLLDYLEALGLRHEQITFLVATGAHHPMSPEEFASILPERVVSNYRVISHDAKAERDLVSIGKTSRGTPAIFNRRYVEVDFRIVVGNIEPHQFMGFSGGVKSAAIGLAAMETINRNHTLMAEPKSMLGEYEDNPARQDVEDLGRLLRVDLALNVVLNDEKEIVEVICGDPAEVMRRGVPRVRQLFQIPVDGRFDLTISSPGGHPKDINLYQAQKALAHAALITRKGGTIVVVAACPEGTGSRDYEEWVTQLSSSREVLERFREEGFRVGPHKAFQIARDAVEREVYLVSEMSPEFVSRLLLTPVSSLEEAILRAGATLTADSRIAVMPYANATMPELTAPADG